MTVMFVATVRFELKLSKFPTVNSYNEVRKIKQTNNSNGNFKK